MDTRHAPGCVREFADLFVSRCRIERVTRIAVWRRHDVGRTRPGSESQHRDAVFPAPGTVVYAPQDVAVNVDHRTSIVNVAAEGKEGQVSGKVLRADSCIND